MTVTRKADVLIVGAGLAGLQAALSAAERHPALRIVIADPAEACASTEIMGFCVPLVPGDSPEKFEEDILVAGAGENDPSLARTLATGARQALEDIESRGLEFDRALDGSRALLRSLGSSFPRVVHHGTTTGHEAIKKYRELLSALPNVEFVRTRILRLFKRDGAICGALGFEDGRAKLFAAKAVVLAAGGAAGLFGFSTWSKSLRGSGYALASDAGAQLTGMERVQFEPCVAVWPSELRGFPIITTLLFEGAKLLDGYGRNILEGLSSLPSKKALVDTMAKAKPCAHGGLRFDFSGVDENCFKLKYPEYWTKLGPHLENVETSPAAHTTLGGVKIDSTCASTIPGLFAAGECAGGIHGADRLGGNAGLEVFVFGRIAGASAAAFASSAKEVESLEGLCEEFLSGFEASTLSTSAFLNDIGNLLDSCVGYFGTRHSPVECASQLKLLNNVLEKSPPCNLESFLICKHAAIVAGMMLNLKASNIQMQGSKKHSPQLAAE